jgi:hypothetical protein
LFDSYPIHKSFEHLLEYLSTSLQNPRSKIRIKGIFESMVSIKSGEIGTEKGTAGGVARNLEFQTDNVSRLVLDSAGASVATTCLLQVGSGGVNNNGEIRARVLRLSDDIGNSTAKIYSTSAYSRDLIHHATEHKFGADHVEFVRFTYSQRVGIGTTSP